MAKPHVEELDVIGWTVKATEGRRVLWLRTALGKDVRFTMIPARAVREVKRKAVKRGK